MLPVYYIPNPIYLQYLKRFLSPKGGEKEIKINYLFFALPLGGAKIIKIIP
jgi:hypothetical protein